MLKRAKATTRQGRCHYVESARFAHDLKGLIDDCRRRQWLELAACKRLPEELAKLGVELSRDETRRVDFAKAEAGNLIAGAGLRPKAKAMVQPLDPAESARPFSTLLTSGGEET
ncbi:MAG: hypothetical protein OXI01_14230 [Albidovulum sp.]|nr:hypothetical protein [Albidovulum sp.]